MNYLAMRNVPRTSLKKKNLERLNAAYAIIRLFCTRAISLEKKKEKKKEIRRKQRSESQGLILARLLFKFLGCTTQFLIPPADGPNADGPTASQTNQCWISHFLWPSRSVACTPTSGYFSTLVPAISACPVLLQLVCVLTTVLANRRLEKDDWRGSTNACLLAYSCRLEGG